MAKRGRKATYPDAGRDRGTEALQARRMALACDGDPVLAESPLGALLTAGRLGLDGRWAHDRDLGIRRHEAGRQFSLARDVLFGRPGVRAAMFAELIPGSVADGCRLSDEARIRLWQRYQGSHGALTQLGALVHRETLSVAVYGDWPEYHHPDYGVMALDVLFSHPLRRHFDALLAGLDCLVDLYGLEAGRRAA